jgi:hypothetical protein
MRELLWRFTKVCIILCFTWKMFAKNKSSCILHGGGQPKRQRVPFSGKGGHLGILET